VPAKSVVWNPGRAELRKLIERMPNCKTTRYQNVNVQTKVVSRSKASTYVVTDHPEKHSDQTIPTAKAAEMARKQDAYLATREVVVIEGYIGNDAEFRVPARLVMEAAYANVAAMQKALYFPATAQELEQFEPPLTV